MSRPALDSGDAGSHRALCFALSIHTCTTYQLPCVCCHAGHALIGGGQALYNPGFAAYLSSVKQRAAAGASAANMAVMFVMSAVLISCAVPLQRALGIAGLFGLLAGLSLLAIAWVGVDLWFRVRKVGDAASASAAAAGAH